MAEVFLARRRGAAGIAKRLVVKRMRSDLTSDPRFAELFLREARVATQLSHKNIVTVFDVGRDPEGLFLAMEYVDGPDVAAAMEGARERGVALDPLLAAHIASEVAAGLDYAHRLRDEHGTVLGLVHRDVTPRNILLSLDGEVKVTDFGVAVLQGDSADERRGTVPYMSPEQARGGPVDPRADLFSLGLVLYELLAGRRAYAGRDKDAMLAEARAGQVPPLGDGVPAELAQAVSRATALDPADRYDSARDMHRELAGWAVGERGRRGQHDPLEHALASFLAAAVPGWTEQTGDVAGSRTVGAAGTATLQSVAETVADGGQPGSSERRLESTESTRRSLRPFAFMAASSLAAVVAAAIVATTRAADIEETGRAGPVPVPGDRRPGSGDPQPQPEPAPTDRDPANGHPQAEPDPEAGADVGPEAGPEVGPEVGPKPAAGTSASSPQAPPARPRSGVSRRGPRVIAPAPPPAHTGTLELNAVPWAYVSIDGRPEEETPIRKRVLSAGRHRIKIRNPVLEKQREIAVDISAGETTRYVVDLRQ
jgi:serine/threonine-protein kinase